jgi:hypothetical protein
MVLKKLIKSFPSVLTFLVQQYSRIRIITCVPNNLALKNFWSNQYSKTMVSFKETVRILNRLSISKSYSCWQQYALPVLLAAFS